MTKEKIRPPFKIHGGKNYLHGWIIDNFPENYEQLNYLEPFCGAASVFLNKKPSKTEILNDLDPGVVQILRALRDENNVFIKKLKKIEYCKESFEKSLYEKTSKNSDLDYAINEFVIRRMSRGGLKKAFSWSDRTRGGNPGEVNAWITILEELPIISKRLKETFLLNKNAFDAIKAFDEKETLCYVDPPYLPDTRVAKECYEFELDTDQHIKLAHVLNNFKGKVVLSGYQSALYKRLYKGWKCVKKTVPNHASQSKVKQQKVECLWINY
jgi:DNA adenine methylase